MNLQISFSIVWKNAVVWCNPEQYPTIPREREKREAQPDTSIHVTHLARKPEISVEGQS